MFYVRHHNDEVTILNAKCPTALIMDRLRKLAGVDLPAEFTVDLIAVSGIDGSAAGAAAAGGGGGGGGGSKSQAQALQLHERCELNGQPIYANTFLAPRATYALLSSHEDEEGVRILKPLWHSTNTDESDKLTASLEAKQTDERKKLGSKKTKR